jgi:RNA polymerase sigma-70 factor (ECF subfamily)
MSSIEGHPRHGRERRAGNDEESGVGRSTDMANEVQRARVTAHYREFGPVVFRRCLRLLGDRSAAQDATQEVFMKLLGSIGQLEDRETVLPWIYRVATNHCLNLLRNARARGEEAPSDEQGALAAREGDPRPDAYVDWALARTVLARFDGATQAVAVGVFVDGMNHDEVAGALGISRRTVTRKLERFVEGARRFLGVEGVLPPTAGTR